MNAKLLFAATVAVSLASTLAMAADQAPLTREQVVSELNQAAAKVHDPYTDQQPTQSAPHGFRYG